MIIFKFRHRTGRPAKNFKFFDEFLKLLVRTLENLFFYKKMDNLIILY